MGMTGGQLCVCDDVRARRLYVRLWVWCISCDSYVAMSGATMYDDYIIYQVVCGYAMMMMSGDATYAG